MPTPCVLIYMHDGWGWWLCEERSCDPSWWRSTHVQCIQLLYWANLAAAVFGGNEVVRVYNTSSQGWHVLSALIKYAYQYYRITVIARRDSTMLTGLPMWKFALRPTLNLVSDHRLLPIRLCTPSIQRFDSFIPWCTCTGIRRNTCMVAHRASHPTTFTYEPHVIRASLGKYSQTMDYCPSLFDIGV